MTIQESLSNVLRTTHILARDLANLQESINKNGSTYYVSVSIVVAAKETIALCNLIEEMYYHVTGTRIQGSPKLSLGDQFN